MPKKDFTQIAHNVVMIATGEASPPALTQKQEAGRKGGVKGGKTRMASLTEEQRRELALRGVAARKKAAPIASRTVGAVKVKKTAR